MTMALLAQIRSPRTSASYLQWPYADPQPKVEAGQEHKVLPCITFSLMLLSALIQGDS